MRSLKLTLFASAAVLMSGAAFASNASEGNDNVNYASYAQAEGNGSVNYASYARPDGNGDVNYASYAAPEGNGHVDEG